MKHPISIALYRLMASPSSIGKRAPDAPTDPFAAWPSLFVADVSSRC